MRTRLTLPLVAALVTVGAVAAPATSASAQVAEVRASGPAAAHRAAAPARQRPIRTSVAAKAGNHAATVSWTIVPRGHHISGVYVGRVGTGPRHTGAWRSRLVKRRIGGLPVRGLPNNVRTTLYLQPLVDGRRAPKRFVTVRPTAPVPPRSATRPVVVRPPAPVVRPLSLRVSATATASTATVRWTLVPGSAHVDGVLVGRDGVSSSGYGAWESTLLPASPATKTMTKLVAGAAYTVHVTPVVAGVKGRPVTARLITAPAPATPPAPKPSPTSPTSAVRLGHWDTSPLRLGPAGLSNYRANKGVDEAMAAALGRTTGVSEVMKAYESRWRTSYASSAVARSAEFGHAFAVTMPAPGGGGNAGYAAILSGSQDAAIDAFFRSVPTSETAYVMLQNEADNVNARGTDPVLYTKALGYVINRAAPIYAARGLKGAVGPVYMGGQFLRNPAGPAAYFERWNFIRYVNPSAKPYALYALDCYSKYTSDDASTYESIPAIVGLAFDRARALGVTRFAIPEFANSLEKRNAGGRIVGTRATQEKWVNTEVPKIEAIPGLEFAVYFHKPTGPESKNAQLLDTGGAHPFLAYARRL